MIRPRLLGTVWILYLSAIRRRSRGIPGMAHDITVVLLCLGFGVAIFLV